MLTPRQRLARDLRHRQLQAQPFGVEMQTPVYRPPEVLPWYWHPDRPGVQHAPEWFDKRLKEIDPGLFVTFSPVHERWIIWQRSQKNRNAMCPGWSLIIYWEHPTKKGADGRGEYLPLSELVFHNLHRLDRNRYRGGAEYYARIEADVAAGKAQLEKTVRDDRKAFQKGWFDSTRISNLGSGNKSALHHDGTVVPSPGEAAWRAETRRWRLPSEVLQAEKDAREKAHYGS